MEIVEALDFAIDAVEERLERAQEHLESAEHRAANGDDNSLPDTSPLKFFDSVPRERARVGHIERMLVTLQALRDEHAARGVNR